MKNHHSPVRLVFCWVILLLIVGCNTKQPTSTSAATTKMESIDTPTSNETEWTYVALGDSETLCCGLHTYPEYYAEFIEQDKHVNVVLHNLGVSGLTSEELLLRLDTDRYRELISKAQVITIVISMNDLLLCPQGDRECAEAKLIATKENYIAIIAKVFELVNGNEVIIRLQTYDNPFVKVWQESGVFEDRVTLFDRWNEQIIEIATQHKIPVADVYHDFNGLQGDEDPIEKGYISDDGMHNSDAGIRRMAELLRDLGYASLSP